MKYSIALLCCLVAGSEVLAQGRPGDKNLPPSPASAPKAAPVAPAAPKTLIKGTPWSPEDILAALKAGADPLQLATAINTDKTVNFFDVDWTRLRNTPEGRRLDSYGVLNSALGNHARQGAGEWTGEMAGAAIAKRRTQTGRLPRIVDSQRLRDKAATGDPEALLALYLLPEEDRTLGKLPENLPYAGLRERILAAGYTRGFWFVGDGYRHNSDKTKDDPVLEADYHRKSAEAGDPSGAKKLAMDFMQSGEAGVAPNFAEVEYWLIEAGARGPEGVFESVYNNAQRDLAMLYAYRKSSGGPIAMSMSLATDAELRWAREMIRRGGKLADTANVYLDEFERNNRTKDVRARMAALAPEVPEFTPVEIARLETAAKAGDISAAAKLGFAYATGRGVRQNDMRATGYLRQAAEKGDGPSARTLSWQYANGYGVKKDPAQRVAWLTKAAEAGDPAAWGELGNLQTYGQQDHGVPANAEAAFAAYQKASAGGYAPGTFGLYSSYKYGRGVAKDPAKALEFLKQAAAAGYRYAQSELADTLVKEDPKAAAAWYQKAFDAGMGEKRYSLARALREAGDARQAKVHYQILTDEGMSEPTYEFAELLKAEGDLTGAKALFQKIAADRNAYDFRREGATREIRIITEEIEERDAKPGTLPAIRKQAKTGDTKAMLQVARLVAPTDKKDALEWVRWAADKDDPEAMTLLASETLATDKVKALEWLHKAAAKNDAQAMLMLAGQTMATDKAAGVEWLKKSATAGNLEAKYRLGLALFQGKELPADQGGALVLLNESAAGGFAPAQFDIGRNLMIGGPGVPADPVRGVELLKKAAAQNHPHAVAVLGEVYERGVGLIAANPAEALKWYQLAVKLGVTQAQPAVQRLQIQLGGKTPPPDKR
ncbi:MAG TPA: tetratricopeptide repeat protein [Opitutaceae bacterium]|nr:tetratricopeptide repeat protein [Opitutaceae bacterium]